MISDEFSVIARKYASLFFTAISACPRFILSGGGRHAIHFLRYLTDRLG
jgi:hypothetical protein